MKPKLSQYFILPVMKFELASSHHWNNVKSLIIESLGKNFTTLYSTEIFLSIGQPHEGSSYAPQKDLLLAYHRVDHIRSRLSDLERLTAEPVAHRQQLTQSDLLQMSEQHWAGQNQTKNSALWGEKPVATLVKEWAVARVSLNVHVFPCGSYMYVYRGIYFTDLKYAFMECLPWCAIIMYSVNVDWWAKTV